MWSLALTNEREVWPALAEEGSDTSNPDSSTTVLRATLMFVYGAREDIERERPDLYAQAARDFLRRGSSFVIKD